MFCPQCGAPNEPDAVFCGNCGAVLDADADLPATEIVGAEAPPEDLPETEIVEPAAPEIEFPEAPEPPVPDRQPSDEELLFGEIAPPPPPPPPPSPFAPPPPPSPAPVEPPPLPPAAAVPTATKQTSGMAIAALVMGVLGWTFLPWLGSILALVFGYMARSEIRQRPDELEGEGLAIAGLVLGWLMLGISVVALCLGGLGFCFLVSIAGMSGGGY